MRLARRFVALAACAVAACGAPSAAASAAAPAPIVQQQFAPETEVDLAQMRRHARGFYWRDLVVGEGRQAAPGLAVHISFVVSLPDGRAVDFAAPERPLVFTLGERQAIAALESALRGMRAGGVRQLVIPPELAYGARGSGTVPPNATLVMVVGLVRVENR